MTTFTLLLTMLLRSWCRILRR